MGASWRLLDKRPQVCPLSPARCLGPGLSFLDSALSPAENPGGIHAPVSGYSFVRSENKFGDLLCTRRWAQYKATAVTKANAWPDLQGVATSWNHRGQR